jgi:hypothetical protein
MVRRIDAHTLELAELWASVRGTSIEEELATELALSE